MVHCSSMPTTIFGRVVPLPLPLEFALTSLYCQNLVVYEPFVDMFWSFTFMNSVLFILPSFLIFKRFTLQEFLNRNVMVKKTGRLSHMPSFT